VKRSSLQHRRKGGNIFVVLWGEKKQRFVKEKGGEKGRLKKKKVKAGESGDREGSTTGAAKVG